MNSLNSGMLYSPLRMPEPHGYHHQHHHPHPQNSGEMPQLGYNAKEYLVDAVLNHPKFQSLRTPIRHDRQESLSQAGSGRQGGLDFQTFITYGLGGFLILSVCEFFYHLGQL